MDWKSGDEKLSGRSLERKLECPWLSMLIGSFETEAPAGSDPRRSTVERKEQLESTWAKAFSSSGRPDVDQ